MTTLVGSGWPQTTTPPRLTIPQASFAPHSEHKSAEMLHLMQFYTTLAIRQPPGTPYPFSAREFSFLKTWLQLLLAWRNFG